MLSNGFRVTCREVRELFLARADRPFPPEKPAER